MSKGDIRPSYQMNNKEEETSAISNKDINTMHKTMVIMNTKSMFSLFSMFVFSFVLFKDP